MSRTYAILHVSQAAYDEVRTALDSAGYHHALERPGLVYMDGIALEAALAPVTVPMDATLDRMNRHDFRTGAGVAIPEAGVSLLADHRYLSAGENPRASGEIAYRGCSLAVGPGHGNYCGRPRSEHPK